MSGGQKGFITGVAVGVIAYHIYVQRTTAGA